MSREITTIRFSDENTAVKEIVKELTEVTKHQMYKGHAASGLVERFSIENYEERADKAKLALLKYCAKNAKIENLVTKEDVVMAFEQNETFKQLYNSIIVETLRGIILKSKPEQILRLANISDVGIGDSDTWELETKGLPIAQRTSYTTNTSFLNSYATSSITITPKPYSIGTSMDYIRILSGSYDIGAELARVAMGMLYAQLKLIITLIYSVAPLTGTPLYQSTFSAENYIQMAEDLKMLNGGSPVSAYGTLVAFNAIGVLATTGYGFASQDAMIRDGYLPQTYGVQNIVIDQFTDLRAPFTTANAADLRAVPNDRIILLSSVGDKPVKLVRENYIRVKVKEPQDGAQYKYDYTYFMSFDAAIVTQAHYGIQAV